MGKKKYDLKRRGDGKVTISTKDDPKTREAFGVGKKRVIDSNKKKKKKTLLDSRAKENLKEEMEKIRQGESKQKEVKTSKDDVRKTDNKDKRTRKIELQNKRSRVLLEGRLKDEQKEERKDASIPSNKIDNLATAVAGGTLLAGIVGAKVFKSARNKQKLQTAMNKINDLPKDQQKEVGKKIGEKVAEKMKNAKPSLKQKIKTKLAQLKKKLSAGLRRSGGGMPGNIRGTTPPGAGNLPPGFKGKSGNPIL